MSVAPKSMWPAVKAVRAQFDRTLDYVTEKLPKVEEHLDTDPTNLLAFASFPEGL